MPKTFEFAALSEARIGAPIIIRYFDHVLFRDVEEPNSMRPIIREAVGWLECVENDFVRLVWERFVEPMTDEKLRTRRTGLAIRRCDIIEVVKIG